MRVRAVVGFVVVVSLAAGLIFLGPLFLGQNSSNGPDTGAPIATTVLLLPTSQSSGTEVGAATSVPTPSPGTVVGAAIPSPTPLPTGPLPTSPAGRVVGAAILSPTPLPTSPQSASVPGTAVGAGTPLPSTLPTGLILVAQEAQKSLVVVDAATNAVQKTVQLGIPVRTVRISPDQQTAWTFDTSTNGSDMYLVDIAAGKVTGTKRLKDGPSSVAFSADGTRAYVPIARGNRVSYLDLAPLNELASIPLGRLTDGAQTRRQLNDAATAGHNELFVSAAGSGVIWARDGGSGEELAQIEPGGGPLALVVNSTGQMVYTVADAINQLVAIDATRNAVVDRIALPGRPAAAAMAPDGKVWVVGPDAGAVWLVDPGKRAISDTIRVGSQPAGITFSPEGGRAYVTNRADGSLTVIDVANRQALATIHVGGDPVGVAFAAPASFAANKPVRAGVTPTVAPTFVPAPTPLPQGQQPKNFPPGVVLETFLPGANFVVALAFAPDGRLFYNEFRTGNVRIVQNGKLQPEPFYHFVVAGQPETGVIGLALDPDFAQNHYVYVLYTDVDPPSAGFGGPHGHHQVVRLTDVNGKGTNLTPILKDLPAGTILNAGHIRFGPDGKLYISLGTADVQSRAENLGILAGKMLRVNPDGSAPADNPFVGQPDRLPEIWAYGLRNSFGFDFEPHTGVIIATENGPGDNDEINRITRGGNYGWPPAGFQDKPGLIDPLEVFNGTIGPAGGSFYRGTQIPQWTNDFFYCNYHRREVRRIHLAPLSFDRIASDEVITDNCVAEIQPGPDGALYFTDQQNIYRLRASNAPGLAPVDPATLPAPSPTEVVPAGLHAEDRDIGVGLDEFTVKPSRDKAPAGHIRFVVENLGKINHELRVVGNGIDVSTKSIPPNGSATLEVNLPPGTYTLICPIENHGEAGMTAKLTIVGN